MFLTSVVASVANVDVHERSVCTLLINNLYTCVFLTNVVVSVANVDAHGKMCVHLTY